MVSERAALLSSNAEDVAGILRAARSVEEESGSPGKLVGNVAFGALAISGAYFGMLLFLRPSLAIENRALRITSAIGSTSAAIFPLQNWILEGQDLMGEGRFPHNPRRGKLARVSKHISAWVAGIFTQFPMCIVVLRYGKNEAAGALIAGATMLTVASPTIRSSKDLIGAIDEKLESIWQRRMSRDEELRRAAKVKFFVLERLGINTRLGTRLSMDERVMRFSSLYQTANDLQVEDVVNLQKMLKDLLMQESVDTPNAPIWHMGISQTTQICMGLMAVIVADVMQTGGMTRDSTKELISDDEAVIISMQILVTFCWLYISAVGPGKVAAKIFGQFTDLAGVPREKTFAEQYYPWISKLSDALAVSISWMMVGENLEIARPYFDQNWLLVADVIACTGYYMEAVSDLGETCIESFARSRFADEESRHAILFRDQCRSIAHFVQNMQPHSVEALLLTANDPELTVFVRERALGSGGGYGS